MLLGGWLDDKRPLCIDELREVDQLQHGLGARLQLGQGQQHRLAVGPEAADIGYSLVLLGCLNHDAVEPRRIGLADVVAVEAFELDEIEARRSLVQLIETEPFDHLFGRENLGIAMRPAEA